MFLYLLHAAIQMKIRERLISVLALIINLTLIRMLFRVSFNTYLPINSQYLLIQEVPQGFLMYLSQHMVY